MNLLRSRFIQAAAVVVLAFCVCRFGIQPPAPWSVIKIYMVIVIVAVFVYVSSDEDSWRSFLAPIRSTLVDPDRRRPPRPRRAPPPPPALGCTPPPAPAAEPVPRQGAQHRGARHPPAQGRDEPASPPRRRRRDLHPQLHVLPRRYPGRARALCAPPHPPAGELPRPRDDRHASGV